MKCFALRHGELNGFTITMIKQESIKQQKNKLRLQMKALRKENEDKEEKDALLLENCLQAIRVFIAKKAEAGTKRKFFIYRSFSSEASTDKLIETLLKSGVLVYCPRVEGDEMVAVEYTNRTRLSKFGILEPMGKAYEGEIDFIITPLLAVDCQGNRLGFGGGFYDKFFSKHPTAKRIAYCYDFQVIEEIPVEPLDERVDCIVTDKRIIQINKR